MLCLILAFAVQGTFDLEEAVAAFHGAETLDARRAIAREIESADPDFDELYALLERGRTFDPTPPTGRILRSRRGLTGLDHKYMILVPEGYSPETRYPVRLDLHGGMGAPEWTELDGSWNPGWRPVSERIVILPAGWWDAMWWEWSQAESIEAILAEVRRTWNIDENRVVVYGGSDGCIATYFYGMRQPDRFAGYAGHVGQPDRLVRADLRPDGQMHVGNLAGQRFHLGFGERDPKAPLRHLKKYMALIEEAGALLDWYVLDGQKHALRLPEEKERDLGRFLWRTVRDPLPERVSWATERTDRYNRRSWLVLDELAPRDGADIPTAGLLPRWGSSIQMRGPTMEPAWWGTVTLERDGNTVRATTERVSRFRVLVSPAEFDLSEPVRVLVDGEVVFEGDVQPSVATLLEWAARDDDRTILFAAEIPVDVP